MRCAASLRLQARGFLHTTTEQRDFTKHKRLLPAQHHDYGLLTRCVLLLVPGDDYPACITCFSAATHTIQMNGSLSGSCRAAVSMETCGRSPRGPGMRIMSCLHTLYSLFVMLVCCDKKIETKDILNANCCL